MSLDLTKLQKVVELSDGVKRARCPACAESGSDKAGQHLRIYPDGKFGCCVHPGDREHRKRIFALAGTRERREIKVRVAAAVTAQTVESGILGRLGRTFQSGGRAAIKTDGPDGLSRVEDDLLETEQSRTLRTGETESDCKEMETDNERTGRTGEQDWTGELFESERTLRTPQLSLVLQQEDKNRLCIYKGFDRGVRCVREQTSSDNSGRRLPYLTPSGDLVIPFSSPSRYHWWSGGQSVKETLAELQERRKEIEHGATF